MNSSHAPSGQPTSGPDKLSFEAALEQLQGIVKKMEGGELSLEQALQSFEEGVRLTRVCQEQLTAAEQKVEVLVQASQNGKIETQPFNSK